MITGLILSVMGLYVLYYSFGKGPAFRRMSAEEQECWRVTRQKPLRFVGFLMIIAGIAQATGFVITF